MIFVCKHCSSWSVFLDILASYILFGDKQNVTDTMFFALWMCLGPDLHIQQPISMCENRSVEIIYLVIWLQKLHRLIAAKEGVPSIIDEFDCRLTDGTTIYIYFLWHKPSVSKVLRFLISEKRVGLKRSYTIHVL